MNSTNNSDWKVLDTSISTELRAYAMKQYHVRRMSRRLKVILDIQTYFSNMIANVRSFLLAQGIGHI